MSFANLSHLIKFLARVINRSKVYAAINFFGLSMGLFVFMLIALYVTYEFGYDRHNEKYNHIYRVVRDHAGNYMGTEKFVVSAAPIADAVRSSIPEANYVTRIGKRGNMLVTIGDKSFYETEYYSGEPDLFNIFSLEVIAGPSTGLLSEHGQVVITESQAVKYFGSVADALGKTITAQTNKPLSDFVVQAVIRDMPHQSHFRMNIIFPFMQLIRPDDLVAWNNNNHWIYFTLRPGADLVAAQARLQAEVHSHLGEDDKSVMLLQPLSDVYTGERMNFDLTVVSSADRLYVFACIGFLVLVIACINYINMATARASNRIREIGVRKVNGALRGDLVFQFMTESYLMVTVSAIVAIAATFLVLPSYNSFLEKHITFNFFTQPALFLFLLALVLLVGTAAGIYPALVFSAFKPITALKSMIKQSHNSRLRHALVVVQFVISGTLIFGTLVVWRQMNYIRDKDLGFNREHVIMINLRDMKLREKHAEIKQKLLLNPAILAAAASRQPPTGIESQQGRRWQTKDNGEQRVEVYINHVDSSFLNFYDIKLLEGSNITSGFSAIDAVVNETLVRELGYTNEEIIGRSFITGNRGDTTRIAGVVKDFHFHDFKMKIRPMEFRKFIWGPPEHISIRVDQRHMPAALEYAEATLREFSEAYPFEYVFYDDHYYNTFKAEAKTSRLMTVFAVVSIFIASLGLYGLILYTVDQRVKEISIRKVLGAGGASIVRLLTGRFAFLILAGYIVSCALGFYATERWLEVFAYKVSPGMMELTVTLVTMLMITCIAIYSRIRIALRVNPAVVLKGE
jgi:putative ABC transport system permease protein